MNEATARVLLEAMVAANDDPRLDERELDLIVNASKRPDPAGNLPTNTASASPWAASTAFAAGTVIAAGGRWWRALNSGVTATTAPDWPDLEGFVATRSTVDDGDVTWLDVGDTWAPTWNLDAGAAMGWRLKAGKAANRMSFTADGATYNRREVIANCLRMGDLYARRGGNGSTEVIRAQ